MLHYIEGREYRLVKDLDPQPRKKVAHLDLDDTLFPGLLMEPLVHEQMKERLISLVHVPALLNEIKRYKAGHKGQESNVTLLNKYWSQGCEDVPFFDLVSHAEDFIERNKDKFSPYTQDVFDVFRENGYDTWVDTGEPPFVAKAVVNAFGGTGFCSTMWTTRHSRWLVSGFGKPMTSEQKGAWAESLFTDEPGRRGYDRRGSIALIDSRNDKGLASAVEYSIVCGTPPTELLEHFEKIGKTFVIASPDNVVSFIKHLIKKDEGKTLRLEPHSPRPKTIFRASR